MYGFTISRFIELFSFSRLLAYMINFSTLTTCVSLNNQPCMTRPTLIDLNPNKYNQQLHFISLWLI